MSKVDEAIIEIDQVLADLAPKHEGLRDFSRLNLSNETQAEITSALAIYDRRFALLTQARDHLLTLQADGHPVLTIPDVSISVLKDLQANAATIEAALAQFSSSPAVALHATLGTPEPK